MLSRQKSPYGNIPFFAKIFVSALFKFCCHDHRLFIRTQLCDSLVEFFGFRIQVVQIVINGLFSWSVKQVIFTFPIRQAFHLYRLLLFPAVINYSVFKRPVNVTGHVTDLGIRIKPADQA